MTDFTQANVPDQAGKCMVVTGANTGIGFAAAKVLAERGARVLLACRDEDKARAAMVRIRDNVPRADLGFVKLDQSDLDSVKAAAEVIAREPRVDVLLNNAGVMLPPLQRTAQGHELQFGVNHLACHALSLLLVNKLAETPGSRVVVTSSVAHKRGRIDWVDLDAHQSYNRSDRYAASKLMNLVFAFELDRRLRAASIPVRAIACHPGVAATELSRHLPVVLRGLWPLAGVFLNDAEQGAWPALQGATWPDAQGGDYYGPQQRFEMAGPSGPAKATVVARDPETARRLWDVSEKLTGVDLTL
ncbi:NAD(P)-dependent dehydrogenase (short-subunit alcohol dehydrogenase family) [Novosphingobium fluoreni]|uniref:NAD(P)-dependent dehydrogenase (Short-subunit alcohol dehydrogenase family) n=1 Tax=Novosphingobium fluoreni TaxID=1391222 RepID=A0A7W6BZM9_9SPHN|nr:NAD(P)-dependent dehydrogenase (short-subunit alcohol dehydrogenase family) [Novosphingobium fluoreni]